MVSSVGQRTSNTYQWWQCSQKTANVCVWYLLSQFIKLKMKVIKHMSHLNLLIISWELKYPKSIINIQPWKQNTGMKKFNTLTWSIALLKPPSLVLSGRGETDKVSRHKSHWLNWSGFLPVPPSWGETSLMIMRRCTFLLPHIHKKSVSTDNHIQ